jgi:hypothetical protein
MALDSNRIIVAPNERSAGIVIVRRRQRSKPISIDTEI